MIVPGLLLAAVVGFQNAGGAWVPFTSQDGNFVVDLPGKPTRSYVRQARSRTGQVKIIVVQCDTPDVLYTAEKVELPPGPGAQAGGHGGDPGFLARRRRQ